MKRRQTQSVSLFPFLAVLVCAMGALILLLLVTTRRIRSNVLQQAAVAQVAEVEQDQSSETFDSSVNPFEEFDDKPAIEEVVSQPIASPPAVAIPEHARPTTPAAGPALIASATEREAEAVSAAAPELPAEEPKPQPIDEPLIPLQLVEVDSFPAWQPKPKAVAKPAPALPKQIPEPEPEPQVDPNIKLKQAIVQLETRVNTTQLQLAARIQAYETERQDALNQKKLLAETKSKAKKLDQLKAVAVSQSRQLNGDEESIQDDINQLQGAVRNATMSVPVETKFNIVPYDGVSGTARRPVLIECTDKGYRFLPEGVEIRRKHLKGFTPDYNPLLIGAATMVSYWQEQASLETADDPSSDPYVLLLVRPSGSMAFYAAKLSLQKLREPFGYELLTDDVEIDLSNADPNATRELQAAVNNAISKQGRLQEALNGLAFGEQGFESGQGEAAEEPGRAIRIGPNGNVYIEDGLPKLTRSNRLGSRGRTGADETGSGSFGEPDIENFQPGEQSSSQRQATSAVRRSAIRGSANARASSSTQRRNGLRQPGAFAGRGASPVSNQASNGAGNQLQSNQLGVRSALDGTDIQLKQGPTNGANPGLVSNPGNTSGEGGLKGGGDQSQEFHDILDAFKNNTRTPNGQNAAGLTRQSNSNRRKPSNTSRPEKDSRKQPASRPTPNSLAGPNEGSQSSRSSSSQDRRRAPTSAIRRSPWKGSKRGWGESGQSGSIGFERVVRIVVENDRVHIANETVRVANRRSSDPFATRVLEEINEHARTWGKPSRGFYWVPAIQLQVQPGGEQVYQHLAKTMKSLGLTVEQIAAQGAIR